MSAWWSGLEWARPEWLVGLAIVPLAALVIAWLGRRRARRLDEFSEATVRHRTQRLPGARRTTRAVVLLVGLAGLLVALAGPRWGVERVEEPPVGQQIVFALDVSRSMLARDAGTVETESRLERSKRTIRRILGGLPAAEAGLVVFAGEASLVVPLTRDLSAIGLYLASVGPDWISDPSTDLANAIAVSVDAFGTTRSPGRAVVLLTDGEDQAGGVEAAVAVAREREIQIETAGVGTEEGARIPLGDGWLTAAGEEVVTRLELEPLEDLAVATGGAHVALSEPGAVAALLTRLRDLDAARAAGGSRERKADRYRWPLALAVACLGLEIALRLGARRRRRGDRGPVVAPAAIVAGIAVLAMAQARQPEELYEDGRYDEALEVWRMKDRGADATPSDAYNRGNAAYRLGRWREAGAGYAVAARTTEERERSSDAWYNAGNARYRIAQEAEGAGEDDVERYWDAAVEAYTKALARDPGDADAKHNLELALRRREESGGGGGGGGDGGDGGGGEGGDGGGSRGEQPPSSGGGAVPQGMSHSEAERLLDALAAREREALERGEDERRAGQRRRPGW